METDPDESIEAALLSMNNAPFALDDDSALLSFLRLPSVSFPLLFELGSLARHRCQPQEKIRINAEEHPKEIRKLITWRFDNDTIRDELQKIVILVEWASGRREEHRMLSWEPESMLHINCKPLLLAFWHRGGGRNSSISIRGGHLSNHYLVHVIHASRNQRRQSGNQRRQYLLVWVGYRDLTWEDGDDVSDELIQEFNAKGKTYGVLWEPTT